MRAALALGSRARFAFSPAIAEPHGPAVDIAQSIPEQSRMAPEAGIARLLSVRCGACTVLLHAMPEKRRTLPPRPTLDARNEEIALIRAVSAGLGVSKMPLRPRSSGRVGEKGRQTEGLGSTLGQSGVNRLSASSMAVHGGVRSPDSGPVKDEGEVR